MIRASRLLPLAAATLMLAGPAALRAEGPIAVDVELDFLKTIFGGDFDPTQYRMLLFGFAMVLIMIWKPRGLIATREPSAFLKDGPHLIPPQRDKETSSLVREGRG